jgi:hypothetical protein
MALAITDQDEWNISKIDNIVRPVFESGSGWRRNIYCGVSLLGLSFCGQQGTVRHFVSRSGQWDEPGVVGEDVEDPHKVCSARVLRVSYELPQMSGGTFRRRTVPTQGLRNKLRNKFLKKITKSSIILNKSSKI